ncbi:purine-cytosine permease family protein [Burkholderia multivorans]|uniref:purine-cytosine permease family protein n=1 Tax=Burkholderia multivorans TaxID=87883 RepID=UPI0019D278E4|nr:allantoin permease [Burkholderia multivorans]MBN6730267.1 allantoin permease [Burkholderia multivorans]MBN6736233.1 allantoin permease [Burkholderia multivorans]MBN7126611.1 allantoin permease [Burkholderia multivorans]MBN8164000.1 allantoin permease [Burkholderia multivorans]MBN8168602.1 allantoin permease [Burkholderia multivorans]
MANLAQARTDEDLDLSTLAIPDHARMPPFSLTMAWWAVCSAVFYIVVGATLALTYGARNALIGMALSVVSYGAVNTIISRYAIRTGLSVALFSRVLFGSAGAALATLIFFATAIYYAVFEGSVIAIAAHHLFPALDYKWAALLVVGYSVPLVFGSVQHWLDKFNGVLLPFYLLGLLAAVGLATAEYGYHAAWLDIGPAGGAPAGGWWHCFVYYMGVWVLMMFTFDYARFGRRQDARYHGRFNFGMPFYLVTFLLNGAAGIYLVGTIPGLGTLSEVSVVLALLKLMGLWGLLFVWVTQSRINTANYYLATVNMQAFFQKVAGLRAPKFVWALVVGAVLYALMMADVFSRILQALAYQGIFVVAWVGVALAHILSARYGELVGDDVECRDAHVPTFNPGGLAAWFAGAFAGLALNHASGFAASLSAPATFAVSWLVYRALLAGAKRTWFVRNT